MRKIWIGCDEWYPFYDIHTVEDRASVYEVSCEVSEETYEKIQKVLKDLEVVQEYLGKRYRKAKVC